MASVNVSLSDLMKGWVEAQAKSGGYSDASDYVRDLIRRDQERVIKVAELQALITQGVESGVSPRSISDVLAAREQAGSSPGHAV